MPDFDPVAGVQLWRYDVELGARTYTLPAQSAAAWITLVLSGGAWTDIVPGWLEDADDLDDALLARTVTHADLVERAKQALETAGGTRWWTALRLIGAIGQEPLIGGELLLAGVHLNEVPLGAVLQAVYRICTRKATKAQIMRLDMVLDQTPPSVSAAQRYDPERAADAFEAYAARRNVQL